MISIWKAKIVLLGLLRLDIVLIVEALTPEFVSKFWQYVQTAGYQHIDEQAETRGLDSVSL